MNHDHSEPHGCGFDFLLKGCPAYVGCLWNVTDIDLDMMTSDILLKEDDRNLASLIARAKTKCTYPYINGSSLVVYGFPCTLTHN